MTTHRPFNNLYIKKATGKTQEWDIYIEENNSKDVWLCMQYGELNGKKIIKKKQIKTAKAKRNLIEEAIKQAETKYNEKINKEGYTTNKNQNTVAIVVRPMLANKFDPKKCNIKFPCIGEPKYDGNRGIIYRKNGEITIESRNGTYIHYFDHIREEVKDLLKNMPETFYLDGELFTQDLTFNVINGLCNKKPSKVKVSIKKEQKYIQDAQRMAKIKYYIFDCFDINQLGILMTERKDILKKLFQNKKYKHLILIEGIILNSIDDVKKQHDSYVQQGGYEGIILRNINAVYELKKRSKHLQKYKEFMDEEFVIVGYEEDAENCVVWTCETNIIPHSQFNVRPRGDKEYCAELLMNGDKYIGAKLIVVFQEYTDTEHGIPRFPVGKDFRNVQDLD